MKKSWKTTVGGLLSTLGAAFQLSDNGTLQAVGGVLVATGILIVGLSAKDHNVTGGTKTVQ